MRYLVRAVNWWFDRVTNLLFVLYDKWERAEQQEEIRRADRRKGGRRR